VSTDSTRVWASEEDSRAEILLELTEKEICASGHKGHAAWLASGLKFQEMQYGFGSFLNKTSDLTPRKYAGYRFKHW
jgi:hypothetical protein